MSSSEAEELRARLAAIRYNGHGMVVMLVTTPKHDNHLQPREISLLPGIGVEGDHGHKQWWKGKRIPGRQISAMNAEVLDALDVPYHVPGDNIVVRGIDLSTFEKGDTLRIGDALLVATGTPHRPCAVFAERTSLLKKELVSEGRLRGTLFDAVHPAKVAVGDSVERLVMPGYQEEFLF